jgi:hypothetical protein
MTSEKKKKVEIKNNLKNIETKSSANSCRDVWPKKRRKSKTNKEKNSGGKA